MVKCGRTKRTRVGYELTADCNGGVMLRIEGMYMHDDDFDEIKAAYKAFEAECKAALEGEQHAAVQ